MKPVADIPVTVQFDNTQPGYLHNDGDQEVTANVRALLIEITTLLTQLLEHNQPDAIDLRSLPLLPGEYEAMKTILGQGEMSVHIEALGQSTVYETALSGVWWITHQNENGDTTAEFIEITYIPAILKSQRQDIEVAHHALQEQLQEWSNTTEPTNQ